MPKMQKTPKISKRKSAVNRLIVIGAVIVLAVSVTLTLLDKWSDVYVFFGLSESGNSFGEGSVTVHFIDVGQGDCTLIITPEKTLLIDGGERDYSSVVINYIKRQGVKKIDYIIATHPHSDHIGGLYDVINEFCTTESTVIMPELPEELTPMTSGYIRLLDSIYNSGANAVYAKPGMKFELYSYYNNNAQIEILSPVGDYDSLNNYSVVSRFSYGDNSFIFTGDIESDAESDIVDYWGESLSADLLHVAHHGSRTSTTAKFLTAVNGDYAVISVGSPNSYNHPNNAVVKRLLDRNYQIFRTDLHGNIVFNCTADELLIHFQNEPTKEDSAA